VELTIKEQEQIMVGKNEVYLTGYLKYPEVLPTSTGGSRLKAKIAVPVVYKDKSGDEKEGFKYYKLAAWNDTAEDLGSLEDGTAVEIVGTLNERSYPGNCKSCGAEEKKYWSDVLVDNFQVVS
jgi:single-stranded DNA-binding protein